MAFRKVLCEEVWCINTSEDYGSIRPVRDYNGHTFESFKEAEKFLFQEGYEKNDHFYKKDIAYRIAHISCYLRPIRKE